MMIRLCKQFFGTLYRDNSGAVAIMFVGFLNVMLGMLALSLDLGRGYMASSEIQNAATAASISSAMESGDVDAARRYFTANLPNGLHSIGYDFDSDVQVTVNGNSVSVVPSGFDVPAFFPLGQSSASASGNGGFIQVGSISTVGMPQGTIQPADYFFTLDVSGSMGYGGMGFDSICPSTGQICHRITAMKEATSRVISSIESSPDSEENYGVALVGWSSHMFQKPPAPPINPIRYAFPLSNNFQAADSLVNSMTALGGTCGECGLNKTQEFLPLSASGRNKVVIFMTDGSMNDCLEGDYCGCDCQLLPTNAAFNACIENCSSPIAFERVRNKCDVIKQDSETAIWAITFGADVNEDPRNAQMRNYCASSPEQSVHVNDGIELDELFQHIFNVTGRIRVTR